MSTVLDWDNPQEVSTGSGDLFHDIKPGLNVFRIVSNAFQFEVHWYRRHEKDTVKRFVSPNEGDPLKARGEMPDRRFAFAVMPCPSNDGATPLLEREVKVLEVGPGIYNDIIKLAKDRDYGNPTNYDIKVTKSGTGRDTKYDVLARPVDKCESLNKEVLEKVEARNIEFTKLYKPSTPQEMSDYIGGVTTSSTPTSSRQQDSISSLDEQEDLFK